MNHLIMLWFMVIFQCSPCPTPGPAGVGAIAAKMFSGLGDYVNFGSNAAGHQVQVAEFSFVIL